MPQLQALLPNNMESDEDSVSNKHSKRKAGDPITEDDDDDGDEDEDSTRVATKDELKRFAEARGIKDMSIRVKSVTTSIDACVREDLAGKDVLLEKIDSDAKSLGILRHLVSVCLNHLAEEDPSNELIFDRAFLQQLFSRIAGKELHSSAKQKHHPGLDPYLDVRKLDDETLKQVTLFPLRCRDALCGEMLTSIKEHVSRNFETRVTEHLACEIEQRLWAFRDDEYFWTNISAAATTMYKAAGQKQQEQALSDIHVFASKERGKEKRRLPQEWRVVLEDLLQKYRDMFEPLRSTLRPRKTPKKTSNKPRKKKPKKPRIETSDAKQEEVASKPSTKKPRVKKLTGREDFFYNVKASLNEVLKIEATFRARAFELKKRRGEIWAEIFERQPSIKKSETKEGYLKQRHLLRETPVPAWFGEGIKMTKKDSITLLRDVANTRKEMWKIMREPGTENPPKPFSLMPHFSLTRAFVKYDGESILTLARNLDLGRGENDINFRTEGVRSAGRTKRLWWTGVFDFHTPREVRRSPRTQTPPSRCGKGRKVLRQIRRFRKGIEVCTKDPWVTDDLLYDANLGDPTCDVPWLVNSITTDGLQVKVCLTTLGKANPLAKGVQELVKKGFTGLSTSPFNVSKHSKGVFNKKVTKLNEVEKARLSSDENHIEVVGVDPGQVSIYATVRADVRKAGDFNPASFKGSPTSFSSREYRHQSLARFSEKGETRRREDNAEYGRAVEAYSVVSLKQPGSSLAYSAVTYSTLKTRAAELLSRERRCEKFTRLRARQRTVDGMARDIAFGDAYKRKIAQTSNEEDRQMSLERKKELLKKIRAKRRVVFFGDGQFGHGSRGPCPRKALIRALGVLCPVVLVDEFRTSKCCCGCGTPLKQVDGSRVFRCESQTDENLSCSVGLIDRDVNGSVNIGVCGVSQLLGLERPSFLCREASGVECV